MIAASVVCVWFWVPLLTKHRSAYELLDFAHEKEWFMIWRNLIQVFYQNLSLAMK